MPAAGRRLAVNRLGFPGQIDKNLTVSPFQIKKEAYPVLLPSLKTPYNRQAWKFLGVFIPKRKARLY